jgi:hypothetical protein
VGQDNVLDESWTNGRCLYFRPVRLKLYEQPVQLPLVTVPIRRYLLTSAKHCFGKMAEKLVSFRVVSPWIMITGIETMNSVIIFFSVSERAQFNKFCNLIGYGSGRNFPIQPAHIGRNRRVDLFS